MRSSGRQVKILTRLLWDVLSIPIEAGTLEGFLFLPEGARGIVLFAHGSGDNGDSPRNTEVAQFLAENGIAALTFDLLTASDENDVEMRHDIPLLAARLEQVTGWVLREGRFMNLRIGYFGAGTGAVVAVLAAARLRDQIGAVVLQGGRVDLTMEVLPQVISPTLLIIGQFDAAVLKPNHDAFARLTCKKSMEIIPGATHSFEEPGKMNLVMALATRWFNKNLS